MAFEAGHELSNYRLVEQIGEGGTISTFDITPDGTRIVFDRLRDHSEIVLIDLVGRDAK